ncbi:DUF927 domain-containing protein [Streptomyces viridosporus]|uniref:DUF927 domain-containing protein n=1 Tax=Streptomyces viridosporus TaxID=67581 RepID=UPI0001AF20BB|nr:DUF927 domain-containing protein [Streptomyces viridosporus]
MTTEADVKAFEAFRRQKAREEKARAALEGANDEEMRLFLEWKAQREQESAEKAPIPRQSAPEYPYSETFGMDPRTATPEPYKVNRAGVHVLQMFGQTQRWSQITYAPLVITKAYTDADGKQSVELAWTDRGKVVRRVVSREAVVRGRELIKSLGGDGLPVLEGDAREVERWLATFEAENVETIPTGYVARYLGWQPDGTFVSGPDGDTRVEVAYEEQKGAAAAHRQKGSLAAWRTGIAQLEGYPVPRVVLAASFAAPLLRPLAMPSFTVDISSRSTRGKTTCLQCGLSVWADPSEDARALASWRTTLIGAEKHLNLVRGLVTALDETMTAESPEIVNSILYDLPKNEGKLRGGGWPSGLQWQTVLLSTGERPALSYSTHQGAAARVLSLTRSPFGENGGAVAVSLRECILDNHGTAGPEFVRRLLEQTSTPEGLASLRAEHEALREQLLGTTDMTGRRAPKVAAVALAEILAHRWGLLPYTPLPVERWQGMFTEVADESDNRPEMAMDVLRAYVASHGAHLYRQGQSTRDDQPHSGWLGLVPTPGSPPWVAIAPEKARRVLADAGYSLDAVLQGWIDAGYLELMKSQRPPHLIKKKILGAQARYLVFTPEGIDYQPYASE